MKYGIGDIVKVQGHYMKVTSVVGSSIYGKPEKVYYKAVKNPLKHKNNYPAFNDFNATIVKSRDGTTTPVIEKISKISRREQILFIANHFKDELLEGNFLRNQDDYSSIANLLGISSNELYAYFTFKLKINKYSNIKNEWAFQMWDGLSKKEKKERLKRIKEKYSDEANFSTRDVWRLLAYYCKYHSLKEAKTVLSRFERFFNKKQWGRIKELWTPLLYPDFDYMHSKFLVCKIVDKIKDGIYNAEILDEGMGEKITEEDKEKYLNRKCIVITKDKDETRIKYLRGKGSTVKVVGSREKPYRNKITKILKITTVRQ